MPGSSPGAQHGKLRQQLYAVIHTRTHASKSNGARRYIEKYQPYLLIEAAPPLLRIIGRSITELYETLKEFGYEPFGLTKFGLNSAASNSTPDRQNWLCLPHEDRSLVTKVKRHILAAGLAPFLLQLNPLMRPIVNRLV